MKKSYDIAVIGGGASGLAAAITSARMAEGASVAVFEKKGKPKQKKKTKMRKTRKHIIFIKKDFMENVLDHFLLETI